MPFTKGHSINKGRVHRADARENMRQAKLGSKNPAYTGGKTELNCERCGGTFQQYLTKHSYPPRFCSKKCSDFLGDEAGYLAKHCRMYRTHGKASYCEAVECWGKSTKYEWANITSNYNTTSLDDWMQLCKSCHNRLDIWHHTITRKEQP